MALITAAQVISICFTDPNTHVSLIKDSYILAAELQYIKPRLGSDLYNLIVTEKASTWTGLNETLYTTYLLPAMAYFVKLKCLPDMNIKTSSQGLMVNTTEFSSQAVSEARAELAEATKQNGELFLESAIKYIEDNPTSFALYYNGTDVNSERLIGGMLIRKGNDVKIVKDKYPWRN